MSADAGISRTTSLPIDRIAEACRALAVARLWIVGVDETPADGPSFLVEFVAGDAGPWGSKVDELRNQLSGSLHAPVHVDTRRGVEQSMAARSRDSILGSARLIYEA